MFGAGLPSAEMTEVPFNDMKARNEQDDGGQNDEESGLRFLPSFCPPSFCPTEIELGVTGIPVSPVEFRQR